MTDNVLHPRILESQDWVTVVFVISFILIAVAKSAFETRFNDYLRLIFSNKYTKIYGDRKHLMSGFTIALFIVQLISFSFFILLALSYFGYSTKTDWILFIRIMTFLMVFILSKFLIEKIIAASFDIEEFTEQFNFQKVSYRTYIGLFILPIDIILYYNDTVSKTLISLVIVIFLATNLFTYLISIKNYRSLLFGKMFYFILYLCALEIAPYYFMYYWFTKS